MVALSYSIASFFYTIGQVIFPANILLSRLRARAGLRWGLPVVIAGYGYFYACGGLLAPVDAGHGDWINLPAAICGWNGIKLVFGGLFVTLKLPYVRVKENLAVRSILRQRRVSMDRAELARRTTGLGIGGGSEAQDHEHAGEQGGDEGEAGEATAP